MSGAEEEEKEKDDDASQMLAAVFPDQMSFFCSRLRFLSLSFTDAREPLTPTDTQTQMNSALSLSPHEYKVSLSLYRSLYHA